MSAILHPTIAMLRSSSLTTVVQQELERRILAGEIAPGTKLNEAALAEALGVSRGPVREAFRMLEEAGLLRQEKNRGVFVRSIALEEAMDLYELREMMETSAVVKLAGRITAEQLATLRELVTKMERAAADNDADTYHGLNLEFHDRVIGFDGNRKLAAIYRRLVKELSLYRRRNLGDADLMGASAHSHRAIVEAIAARDVEAARQAIQQHVSGSRDRTRRLQEDHPDA